jgi:hypothetical protein
MRKTILIGLLTGALTLAMATSIGISNLGTVDAQCADPPCNGWGQAAKNTIEVFGGQTFGAHTSNPPDPDPPLDRPGRQGVGNLADQLTGTKNPSNLGDAVTGTLP